MIILNAVEDILIIFLAVFSFYLLYKDRHTVYGLSFYDNGVKLTDGRQGMATTFGRSFFCDVRMKNSLSPPLHANVEYSAKLARPVPVIYGNDPSKKPTFDIKGHHFTYKYPVYTADDPLSFVIPCVTALFVMLQMIGALLEWQQPLAAVPHILLLIFTLAVFFMRTDKKPIAESVMTVFLTYYIEAVLYSAKRSGDFQKEAVMAIAGVSIYILVFIFSSKLFATLDMKKRIGKGLTLHIVLRVLSAVAIAGLIALNILKGVSINDAKNWVYIFGVSVQVSEMVKVLLAFALIVPTGKRFTDPGNLIFSVMLSAACIGYAYVIQDIGALLQFAIIIFAAVLLQNSNVLYSVIMCLGGVIAVKIILRFSATAASRVSGWMGTEGFWSGITAKGIFESPGGYGYQSVHAMVAAVRNGALLGNNKFDVLSGITSANADLVTAFIAQKHGYPVIFLILLLYLLLTLQTVRSFKQKNKFQQIFSYLAIVLMVFAMALNLGGTFGITALTGVVSPALSDGASAAVCYGFLFGMLASSSLKKSYINEIKEQK